MRFKEHSIHVEEISTNTMGCTMNTKLQCMRETCDNVREIQQTSCRVTWKRSCKETIYWQQGNFTSIMCCTMNWKLQKMQETLVLEKKTFKPSCAVPWQRRCTVCEKRVTRRKFNRHQVLEHAETCIHRVLETFILEKEIHQTSCALSWTRSALYTRHDWSWEGKLQNGL